MLSSFRFLIAATLFLINSWGVNAQENDYLMHGKIFSYCSFKKDCSGCYNCEDKRYEITVKNKQDKKIKSIHYKVYSSLYNHTEIKDAKIEGNIINAQETGFIFICVPDIKQWYISEITYDDNTSETFEIKGRLEDFVQETDECD